MVMPLMVMQAIKRHQLLSPYDISQVDCKEDSIRTKKSKPSQSRVNTVSLLYAAITHMVSEGLWGVVYYNSFLQISA